MKSESFDLDAYYRRMRDLKALLPYVGQAAFGAWWQKPMHEALDIHPKAFARWMAVGGQPPLKLKSARVSQKLESLMQKKQTELEKARTRLAEWSNGGTAK